MSFNVAPAQTISNDSDLGISRQFTARDTDLISADANGKKITRLAFFPCAIALVPNALSLLWTLVSKTTTIAVSIFQILAAPLICNVNGQEIDAFCAAQGRNIGKSLFSIFWALPCFAAQVGATFAVLIDPKRSYEFYTKTETLIQERSNLSYLSKKEIFARRDAPSAATAGTEESSELQRAALSKARGDVEKIDIFDTEESQI